jgi:quinolinate synthase
MYQAPLPQEYVGLSAEETRSRIAAAKLALGNDVVILGHHYQRDEIIEHADFRGDSFKLCNDAALRPEATFIIFCGVHFMAESAAVLTEKRVILPNLAAGCSMADMANLLQVRACWKQLDTVIDTSKLVPVTYINSAANLKGFVGERGGTVCTSSNAPVAVQWALSQGEKVLFFPDQHLGRNTAAHLGYDADRDMVLWDPFKPMGGNTAEQIRSATFILWKGHCSVHARFTTEQIAQARAKVPDVHVLVHPECSLDVVRASDSYGSTEHIIKRVSEAPEGTAWAIGTEINLVSRLAKENPGKTIFCLDPQICPCSTMYRIHPTFLLWTLERLLAGEVMNEVTVPEKTSLFARLALDRMLQLAM